MTLGAYAESGGHCERIGLRPLLGAKFRSLNIHEDGPGDEQLKNCVSTGDYLT